MKPGRELDALVAEKVMRLTLCRCSEETLQEWAGPFKEPPPRFGSDYNCNCCGNRYLSDHWNGPGSYSTDIAAAWEVVEKVDLLSGCVLQWDDRRQEWLVGYYDYDGHLEVEASGSTAPHAICLAALTTVG